MAPLLAGLGIQLGSSLLNRLRGGRRPAAATPEEAEQERLRQMAARMTAEASAPLTEQAGYVARIGGARDAMREDAQNDAARAATMGLTGGTAIAAGAGQRARALAGVERGAVGDAEARRERLLALSASLTGQNADRALNERSRRDQQRAGFMGALGGFASTALQGYLGLRRPKTT